MTVKPVRYSTDIVVIDLEATCPEQDQNDINQSCIIEIGAVRLDRKTLGVVDTFAELVNPGTCPITPFIAHMTRITPEMVANCDEFDKVGARFAAWHGPRNRAILAAFGAYYDLPLLRKEWKRVPDMSFRQTFVGSALDIRALAMAWLATHGHNTTGVTIQETLKKMGVTLPFVWHRALDDAKGAAAILQYFHLGEARV